MSPVLHLPHILREWSQRYPVSRYGHADHADAPAQPCEQFRELLIIDLHGRTPRADAAKLRQVATADTEDEYTELAVGRQFLQSSLQLPVPGAGRNPVRHHDEPGLVVFHPMFPIGTFAVVEFDQSQLDGFTQKRFIFLRRGNLQSCVRFPDWTEFFYRRYRPGKGHDLYVSGQFCHGIGEDIADEPLKAGIEFVYPGDEIVSCNNVPVDSVRVFLPEDLLIVASNDAVHTAAGIQQKEDGKPGVGVVAELAHGGELFLFGGLCR